jgi:hypothetical protein
MCRQQAADMGMLEFDPTEQLKRLVTAASQVYCLLVNADGYGQTYLVMGEDGRPVPYEEALLKARLDLGKELEASGMVHVVSEVNYINRKR